MSLGQFLWIWSPEQWILSGQGHLVKSSGLTTLSLVCQITAHTCQQYVYNQYCNSYSSVFSVNVYYATLFFQVRVALEITGQKVITRRERS